MELLVVVSIIALLISILLPSLKNAREQAKMVKCLAHMRGAGMAASSFTAENNGYMQLVASEGIVGLADPGRRRYAYGEGGELLSWPVALARASGMPLRNNWDWGVRASSYSDAAASEAQIDDSVDMMVCPSDRVRISSAFFPRHEPSLYGAGLKGTGDPRAPVSPSNRMSYWGRLSFGINEDITGGDGADNDYWASCWRAARGSSGWQACNGGIMYGPSTACFSSGGHRLKGNFDKVFGPSEVGLIFETGPESSSQASQGTYGNQYANLVNSTARREVQEVAGPYLGNMQQTHPWRIPTNRHPNGRLNVVNVDMHGYAINPKTFRHNSEVNRDLPFAYSPRVRVSPYNPHGVAGE